MEKKKRTVEKKVAVKNGITRLIFVAAALILQLTIMVMFFTKINEYAEWISFFTRILAFFLVIGIYSQHKTSSMKTPWIVLILILPIFGTALYLLIGLNGSTNRMRKRYEEIDAILLPILKQDEQLIQQLEMENSGIGNIAKYLVKYSGYPIYQNTDITYYTEAEEGLEAQKEALRRAEKFILMEYHAIEDAQSWKGIQDILEERVNAGVEVRLIYDDIGSIGFIDTDFVKRMRKIGIQCKVFNPVFPIFNLFFNNRDHRKITVIDGVIGFTGGYNLANEYFNITHPYGHWKDTGIRIVGEAVKSLTITFFEMWEAEQKVTPDVMELQKYLPTSSYRAIENGFVQPYADNPMDYEQVGENVYISLIEQAKKYIWFISPYLILTDEMIHALGLAAKRGVDVRIITPGIPDKKLIYSVTRSYYNSLTRNGVKIYEYSPGFCHCKMCVSDDEVATCGTINLDFRSLYHHFENGCLYYQCEAVRNTKKDFEGILAQCEDVTEFYTTGRGAILRFGQLILRLFAPLL